MTKITAGCVILSLALLAAVGCHSTPDPDVSTLTVEQRRGHDIYFQMCARCHQKGDGGPTLRNVMKKKYFSSGTPANDDRAREIIMLGHGMMPSYRNTLSQQQISDVIAYLHAL